MYTASPDTRHCTPSIWTRSLCITYVMADVCIHAPENNKTAASLYWRRLTIIYFWCHENVGLYLSTLYIIEFLMFQRWQLGRLIPETECWTSDSLFSQAPWRWNSGDEICRCDTINCVLGCVLYCILWGAFVGQYIEDFFAVTLYGTLQVPQIYFIVCYLTYQWLCYILACDLPLLRLLSN